MVGKNIFKNPTSEHDGAGLWRLALCEEGEVLVADLLDFEESALGADVLLLQLLRPVNDGGADSLNTSQSSLYL